jgi:hypothetical protein
MGSTVRLKRSALRWLWLLCAMLIPAIASAAGALGATIDYKAAGSPQFTSANSTTFTAGQVNTFTVTVTGTPTPSIRIRGKKPPAGITFVDNHDGTGTLSSTAGVSVGGVFSIRFVATNGIKPTGKQTFALTINRAPAITSANAATCAIGVFCSFTVTTTGFPPPTITRTGGGLPAGINFIDNGNGTGTLSGTPGGATQGSYPFQFTAANGIGANAVQNFTLTVNQFLVFTSANNTTCVVGTPCTFSITANGVPLPTISHTEGALPDGVTFVANGPGSASLTGTPHAGFGGIYLLTFKAVNGVEPDAVQSFTLTVNEAPSITTTNATTCAIGTDCTFTVDTLGYPDPTIGLSGDSLPSGVDYFDNLDGTATFTGIPDTGTNGTYHLTFTASNGIGSNAVQAFTLTVNLMLAITSDSETTCVVGAPCTLTVTTNGTPPPAINQTGTRPSNITFTDNGNGTATLSGTAVAGTGGHYPLTLTASNGIEANAVQAFTLTVNEAPSFTSTNNTTCTVGTLCTFTVTTLGFPGSSVARTSGTLPSGIDYINNANGTGTLSGTAAATTGGQYTLGFTASNGIGTNATQSFTLTVNEAPSITSTPPPGGAAGTPYTHTYTAIGYPAPTFSVTAGALPPPLVLSPIGVISGTPGAGGIFTGTVTATNGIGVAATQNFNITITNFALPGAPQNVSALSGNGQAVVSFSPPASNGGSPINGYTVTCTPAAGLAVPASGSGSPITVLGLTNGVTYTCTVHATTLVGDGPESAASNPVTPSAAAPATLTIVVRGSGTGTVDSVPPGIACPIDCSEIYPAGTGVMLTATATNGSVFTGWLGGGCGLATTCTVTVNAATTVSATFAEQGTTGTLDIDDSDPSTKYDALTDGVMIIRYLFSISGPPLVSAALGQTAQRTDPADVLKYLEDIRPRLDVDGDGNPDALTDGVVIIRYLFQIIGPPLTSNATAPGAPRTDPTRVEDYLRTLTPQP